MTTIEELIYTWHAREGINSLEDILKWINRMQEKSHVEIKSSCLSRSDTWFYDKNTGVVRNKNNSFFQISGIRQIRGNEILREQPIILQNEIGYLGILCKKIAGTLHFLMQAKVEPGNVNDLQISPTVQATKSNFTQKHGGKKPSYLEFFINSSQYEIIVDQLQSEPASRFYRKRNRNIIIRVSEETPVELLPNYCWMTLGQIKALMKSNNLVNMCTRTVLSCIPCCMYEDHGDTETLFNDKALYASVFAKEEPTVIPRLFNFINNYKMMTDVNTELIPLHTLTNWEFHDAVIKCQDTFPFEIIFCDITIDGREVRKWTQPLFKANGRALFGLITSVHRGKRVFLVKTMAETGCFDSIELGPTVQLEAGYGDAHLNDVERLFISQRTRKQGILYDVLLSEEGGRFYREENDNQIIEVENSELFNPPEGYFWVDYRVLNRLIQMHYTVNVQLRNLLSLLEV